MDITSYLLGKNSGGGGSGGLEYEEGIWQPTSDIARGNISFAKEHSVPPFFLVMIEASGEEPGFNENVIMYYVDWYRLYGIGYYRSNGACYCSPHYGTTSSSNTSVSVNSTAITKTSDETEATSTSYPRYWVSPTGFRPYGNSASKYWKAGKTYKWIAVWK